MIARRRTALVQLAKFLVSALGVVALSGCGGGSGTADATIPPIRTTSTTTTTTTTIPTETRSYQVQRGDTLSSIAGRFNISVAALVEANGFSDADYLQAGQRIEIPPPLPDAATSTDGADTEASTSPSTTSA